MQSEIYRKEFPRPDFKRRNWICLNGTWEFEFDYNAVLTNKEGLHKKYTEQIQVPFCYQSQLSGIKKDKECHVVWYRRKFTLEKDNSQRVLVKFGAVDYLATVWVNDNLVGCHEGGHSSFMFDITEAVLEGENTIVVKVEDYQEADKPRGKQSWTGKRFGCWYTPTTGIWQSVWLEFVPKVYLKRIKITPDLENHNALCELCISDRATTECRVHAYMKIEEQQYDFGIQTVYCCNGYGKSIIAFPDFDLRRDLIYWSPEHPNLINVDVEVIGLDGKDQVSTYFGMRSIKREKNQILLNQEVYFQRLVLDQGYWEESLLTPPSEEAIIKDLQLIKEMGFNGVRMHQKIEDPLFYYHADRIGLLVWGELPSSYEYNDGMVKKSVNELMEFVERDYNHPSIITWVPVNESWGVRDIVENVQQQKYAEALTCLLKAIDVTRLVSSNDGWEQPECTDICAIHDYIYTPNTLGKYDEMKSILEGCIESRLIFAKGHQYQGQPIILSEYGGIAFDDSNEEAWGYLGKVKNPDEFLNRLAPITEEIITSGKFAGFCYTQLTDVEQEVNGLLTPDRQLKIPIEKLKSVFGRKFYE